MAAPPPGEVAWSDDDSSPQQKARPVPDLSPSAVSQPQQTSPSPASGSRPPTHNARSPSVRHTAGRSRRDFENILASGSDPSDEVRRSPEYAEWYFSMNPRDPRALAPLSDPNQQQHIPSSGAPPLHWGGGGAVGGRGGMKGGMQLDTAAIHNVGPGGAPPRLNPYAMSAVTAYSMPSPGTQFYSQFAPSPMVGGPAESPMHRGYGADEAAAVAAASAALHQHHHHHYGAFIPNMYQQQYGGNPNMHPAQLNNSNGGSPMPSSAAPQANTASNIPTHLTPYPHHPQQPHGFDPTGATSMYDFAAAAAAAAAAGAYPGYHLPSISIGGQQLHPGTSYEQQFQQAYHNQQLAHPNQHQAGGMNNSGFDPSSQPWFGGGGYGGADLAAMGMLGGRGGGFGSGNNRGMGGGNNNNNSQMGGRGGNGVGGRGNNNGGGRGGGFGGRGGNNNDNDGFNSQYPRSNRGGGYGSGSHNSPPQQQQTQSPAPQQPRSELLEMFRNTSQTHPWRLEDINGHALEFARDQEGSRFIQRMVDVSSADSIDALFREIFKEPLELITDVFGNYVLQKLLEVGNRDQLLLVAQQLRAHVVPLTLQTYGCRVIQKCIDVMPPQGLDVIITELQGNVAKCIQDQNGNHVVQKCVEVVPDRCGFIVEAFTGRVRELATHAYGCRVIQCIMQNCPAYEKSIFEELLADILALTEDQYGNYVVQHVLLHTSEKQVEMVFEKLKDHFYRFSVHKFASNVMERLFSRSNETQRAYIIQSITRELHGVPPEDCGEGVTKPPTQLFYMMKDQFANYVIQKVVDHCSDPHKRLLMISTQPYVTTLRRFTFGKHMVARLERMKLLPVQPLP